MRGGQEGIDRRKDGAAVKAVWTFLLFISKILRELRWLRLISWRLRSRQASRGRQAGRQAGFTS